MGAYVKSIPKDKIKEFADGLAAVNVKYELLWRFGVTTGLRISDILGLRVRQFKKRMSVIESKTGKKRVLELPEELINIGQSYIKAHQLKSGDALFYSTEHSKQKAISRVQVYNVFRRVAATLRIDDVGTHSMRKTFAVNLMQETNSIQEVQKALGHKHVETTLRYLFNFEKLGDVLGLI
jgi:integrase